MKRGLSQARGAVARFRALRECLKLEDRADRARQERGFANSRVSKSRRSPRHSRHSPKECESRPQSPRRLSCRRGLARSSPRETPRRRVTGRVASRRERTERRRASASAGPLIMRGRKNTAGPLPCVVGFSPLDLGTPLLLRGQAAVTARVRVACERVRRVDRFYKGRRRGLSLSLSLSWAQAASRGGALL